jgi:hypothetical protein
MWKLVERSLSDIFRLTGSLEREHWIFVFAGAVVIGAFLLRGFGSRI